MAIVKISGVSIRALATAVPENTIALADELDLFDGNSAKIERLKQTIGLDRRRVAPDGMTALDMAEAAVRRLLADTQLSVDEVDAIVMVTQTPDYLQPCNAVLLQGRIGFPDTSAAFDMNLGCSGYVYGLWNAFSLVRGGGLRRVILVVGDTISRIVAVRDRALRPLFGDAASATLVEADPAAPLAAFDLRSDGRGYRALWQPGGAFREPWSAEATQLHTLDDGVERSRCHLHMDGAEIFNFSLRVEPAAVSQMLAIMGWDATILDGVVFHQANRYIIDNIRRRLKLPPQKVPAATVERFGNQSSASIPATLADHYGQQLCERPHRLILSGFGVGLSWATAGIHFSRLTANSLIEI